MVSTLRCGRSNPGSNPGYGRIFFLNTGSSLIYKIQSILFCTLFFMTFQFPSKVTDIPTPMLVVLVFEDCPLFRFAAFYLWYFQLFCSEFGQRSRQQRISSRIPIKSSLTNALPNSWCMQFICQTVM